MFNVLFPSGRVMEFGTIEVATLYVTAYNGTLLPNITLDNVEAVPYNGCVVDEMEII